MQDFGVDPENHARPAADPQHVRPTDHAVSTKARTHISDRDVKTVVAWGSLSYAFGFVTVMLHTWRLGFPVLELLSSVYIWVGLPLAIVAFFSTYLIRFFAARSAELAKELRTSWEHLTGDVQKDAQIVSVSFSLLTSVVPALSLLKSPLERLIRRASDGTTVKSKRAGLYMSRLAAFLKGATTIVSFLRLVYAAGMIALGVVLYVWDVYPSIPQSLGGGRPATVRLILVTEKAAALFPELQDLKAQPTSAEGLKTIMTSKLQLLYATKDNYYLSSHSGLRLSLSKDAVAGVVWNP